MKIIYFCITQNKYNKISDSKSKNLCRIRQPRVCLNMSCYYVLRFVKLSVQY